MIKDFKLFENTPTMDYIIGIPSGQIIDIDYKEINNLKRGGYIVYRKDLNAYVFNDDNYNGILFYLKPKKKKERTIIDEDYITQFFDEQRSVRSFQISRDGVEVSGSVFISGRYDLYKIPFKFKSVTGDFIWRDCKLDSLENSPRKVGQSFIVDTNNLFDLIGGPIYVGMDYNCSHCLINSLVGSPESIRGNFDCSDNFLVNLKGGPKIVKGLLDLSDNNYLKNIKEMPECSQIIGPKEKNLSKKLKNEGDGKYRW